MADRMEGMGEERITSAGNPQMRRVERLMRDARFRRSEGAFVVEGRKMLEEAWREGLLEKAYFSEEYFERNYGAQGKAPPGLRYAVVSDRVFRAAADTVTPQGAMAVARIPRREISGDLGRGSARILLLEDIRDPGNLGTIVRTAEGAGMDGVVLAKGCADVFAPKAARSTMGSVFRMPLARAESLREYLIHLKKNGIVIYAAHPQGAVDYDEADYGERVGILIGNEAGGLSEEALSLSDKLVRIPMAGRVESLNAAVAAALLMYRSRGGRGSR